MTPVLDAHRAQLRAAFLDWLVELGARDVLDLGAGHGELVAGLAARGIDAAGLEADPERVADARALDRRVASGRAESVERPDGSVGWVVLRHVLHHLERPGAALAEAVRVAREGLLIAEPISLSGLAVHEANRRMERALRALDRSRGVVHGPDLAPETIAELLPSSARVEVRLHAPLTPLPPAEVRALIERSAGGAAIPPAEREDLDAALEAAARGALVPSGSAMIAARFANVGP